MAYDKNEHNTGIPCRTILTRQVLCFLDAAPKLPEIMKICRKEDIVSIIILSSSIILLYATTYITGDADA